MRSVFFLCLALAACGESPDARCNPIPYEHYGAPDPKNAFDWTVRSYSCANHWGTALARGPDSATVLAEVVVSKCDVPLMERERAYARNGETPPTDGDEAVRKTALAAIAEYRARDCPKQ